MEKQDHPIQEEDIFESQVMKQPEDQNKRLLEAQRVSAIARGEKEEEQSEQPIAILNLSLYAPKLNYYYGMQGVLLKESPNLFGGWDERYCVLKGQRFVYKQDEYPTSPNAGILNFHLLSCQLFLHKEGNVCDYFTITVANTDKHFVFKAQSTEETAEWIRRLNEAIRNSQGFGKNYSYLAHYPRFWRKDYEGESEFRRAAETGDVVLFRGKKGTSLMQRAITGDQFDHVAVVLLNSKGDIVLFEANGGLGVGVCPWNRFILKRWYQMYDLVVHRHLNVLRTDAFLQEVDQFVAANMGKKYDFSLKEYLFNRTSTGDGERDVYFCSSLVAKLYKRLQLLQEDKSCTQYLPSWFSTGSGTLRSDGKHGYAYFNDEKIIVFENL